MSRQKLIMVILVTLTIGLILWRGWEGKSKNNEQTGTKKSDPYAEYVVSRLKGNAPVVERLMEGLKGSQKDQRFRDLFAPLGVLDVNVDVKLARAAMPAESIEFGYFAGMVKYTKEESEKMVMSPLVTAGTKFNQKDYFRINRIKLDKMQTEVEQVKGLQIMGDWKSYLRRINNVFVDDKLGWIWRVSENNYNFEKKGLNYDFEKEVMSGSEAEGLDPGKLTWLTKTMEETKVTTIYKCGGVTIYVLDGVTNNAYGLVYNAKDVQEVNCGLLEKKFDFATSENLDERWMYWVGR